MTRTLGLVPLLGRNPLVQACLSGESLADRAVRAVSAVTDAVVVARDEGHRSQTPSAATGAGRQLDVVELPGDEGRLHEVLASYGRVLVHEPLCPFVPRWFLQQLSAPSQENHPVAGVRPAVDTVKASEGGFVQHTVPRDSVRLVTTPVSVDASDLSCLTDLTRALHDDLSSLVVELLRLRPDFELVVAPSSSRRVGDEDELFVVAQSESAEAAGQSRADAH